TFICACLLYAAGMAWFDAVNHAMTTISTGGFSTHDASIAYFDSPAIEAITIVFMMAGAMPLVMYAHFFLARHGDRALKRYTQVRGFIAIWLAAVAAVGLWN